MSINLSNGRLRIVTFDHHRIDKMCEGGLKKQLLDFGGSDKLWKIDQVSIDIHLGFQKMLTVKELTRALMFLIGV